MREVYQFEGTLKLFIDEALNGTESNVDFLMSKLNANCNLATTRYIDFALSLVSNKSGVNRIEFYLMNGTQIQRNYSSLYFNRRGDWKMVKKAFDLGLIDEIQAYSR